MIHFLLLALLIPKYVISKTVLITGGMGFVGRHFVHRMCKQGWKVTVVDNMISESSMDFDSWPHHLKVSEECELYFFQMDCRDFFKEEHEHFNMFIHLAAVVGGRATIEGSPLAVADDLAIDSAAFQWVIKNNETKPDLMIYFSSSAAYPIKYQKMNSGVNLKESFVNLGIDGDDIGMPDLTYGWAKLTGEYLARLANKHYGVDVAIFRPMSGYGEDQDEAYPFKSLLTKASRKDNPIHIWSDASRFCLH